MISGSIKILFLVVIVVCLIAISLGGKTSLLVFVPIQGRCTDFHKLDPSTEHPREMSVSRDREIVIREATKQTDWSPPTGFDKGAADNWFIALLSVTSTLPPLPLY